MSESETTAGGERVLADAPSGLLVDLSDLPEQERVVSGSLIRRLCVGGEAEDVDPRGIRIKGARIVEPLNLSFCTVPHPLRFEATRFEVPLVVSNAHLPALCVTDCSLPNLLADGIRVDHDLEAISSKINGPASLAGARIGGRFNCWDATFADEYNALDVGSAEIDGDVLLGGSKVTGTVNFSGAKIGGQLECANATFGRLYALRVEIGGDIRLNHGFSNNLVTLSGAKIGGQLDCWGATLNRLEAFSAEIDGDVKLGGGFSANGGVMLDGAKIGGQLDCRDATLNSGSGKFALRAARAEIGAFIFQDVRVTGGVDLSRASATSLDDDLGSWGAEHQLGSWRDVKPLLLEGFSYALFARDAEWRSKIRCQWLERTSGFQQGAWQQLIDVYRAQGRDGEATRTAIAMHNDRRRRANLPWYRREGRRALGIVLGHGYQPWLAGLWAIAIIAAFALVVAHWSPMFAPETKDVTGSPQPIAYATDTFLPIVDLGQSGDWMPTGWVRWVEWSVILLGWSLTTLFVAGFTRIVRSE